MDHMALVYPAGLYLSAGDRISAGAYASSFPINLYGADGHNLFTVTLIKEYTL